MRLTDLEWGFSNMPAFEKTCTLFCEALHKAGQSFSPNGLHMGLQPMMPRLVMESRQSRDDRAPLRASRTGDAITGFLRLLVSAHGVGRETRNPLT
jgi:hypothetical protein